MRHHKIPGLRRLDEISEPRPPKHGHCWGRWRFNKRNLTLELKEGNNSQLVYYIDLEQCVDALSILDRILQVACKGWAKGEEAGNLVIALEELAKWNLQGLVCPFGLRGQGVNYRNILTKRTAPKQGGKHRGSRDGSHY